jgi:hypothetical protein
MAFEQVSLVLAGIAIFLAAGYAAHSKLGYADMPDNIPWVGLRYGAFADLRTRFASLGGMIETIESGYRKVCNPTCPDLDAANSSLVLICRYQFYSSWF